MNTRLLKLNVRIEFDVTHDLRQKAAYIQIK